MGKSCTQKAEMVYDKEAGSQPDREMIFTGSKWQKRRKQRRPALDEVQILGLLYIESM